MSVRTDLSFWIYDFEVFKHDWMVTFKNHWTSEIVSFHNDKEGLTHFINTHPEMILVGYNNAHYDDWILFGILNDINPYDLSTYIVEQGGSPYIYPGLKNKYKRIVSYDLIKDMSLGGVTSLKQLEGYLGFKIFESKIPWDIDRPLTQEEYEETLKYNIYDVEVTDFLFKHFGQRIDAHIALIEHYHLKPDDLSKTGAQKAALIFKAEELKPRYKTFVYEAPPVLKKHLTKDLLDFYEQPVFSTETTNSLKQEITIQDHKYELGLGGLHGAIPSFNYEGEIWNLDVASFYPNLMIHYNYISRACPGGVKALEEITQLRLKYKREGHILNNALKLIIVAIYGNMAYKYSKMWDQLMQNNICITGQLMLLWLIQLLEPHATIIQANTDGVMFIPHNKEKCEEVWHFWEQETKMVLELDVGSQIIQKDVNNYIYLKKPKHELDPYDWEACEKYIKVKGGMTRFWNDQMHKDGYNKVLDTFNNTLTILDECVVRYLVWGTPIRETLERCNDPLRFMKVVKLQGKYKQFYLGDTPIDGKNFRLFFTLDGDQPYKTYVKDDELKKEKFANCSSKSTVINEEIKGKTIQELGLNLDLDYYEELAKNMINLFNK